MKQVYPYQRQRAKAWYLILWHRLTMRSSALQPWKGQLTGIGYSTAVQASSAHCPRNGLWTRSYAARYTMPQSATLGLYPIIHVRNYMDYYSFTRPRNRSSRARRSIHSNWRSTRLIDSTFDPSVDSAGLSSTAIDSIDFIDSIVDSLGLLHVAWPEWCALFVVYMS